MEKMTYDIWPVFAMFIASALIIGIICYGFVFPFLTLSSIVKIIIWGSFTSLGICIFYYISIIQNKTDY